MEPRCPYCGEEMIHGIGYIRGTVFGYLLVGLSYQHFWFQRSDTSEKEIMLRCYDKARGHQCPGCGAVSFQRPR